MDTQLLTSKANAWAANDVDEGDRQEISQLVQQQKWDELKERFSAPLEFGTAGLRGLIGAGLNRMNRAVVRRTTWGLGKYLLETFKDQVSRGVVIGRDGRKRSDVFADDAAAVLTAMGITVHFLPDTSPTPLTAFAVTHLKAVAGIMVTASHNPPDYNGYKVYWENGAQIIPPHDRNIAAWIEQAPAAKDIACLNKDEVAKNALFKKIDGHIDAQYLSEIDKLRPTRTVNDLKVVYTAMHGVGAKLALQAFKNAGFKNIFSVKEQQEPDGNFPTVHFPNPEEKGALDLSLALAEKEKADLVVANDPDADRLALAARRPDGKIQALSGNELGVMLGHYLLTQPEGAPKPDNRVAMTTIVSSSQLVEICRKLNVQTELLLTGFKWIANKAIELEKHGKHFVFGYEEALGYTVGPLVRDKDGIGSALVAVDMAAWCKKRNLTVWDYLEEIQRSFGLFQSSQLNFTFEGSEGSKTISKIMEVFRREKIETFDGQKVTALNDYQEQVRHEGAEKKKLTLPKSNVLAYELQGGDRITIRPSGTEPKIKIYFEHKESVDSNEKMDVAKLRAKGKLEQLSQDFVRVGSSFGLPLKTN